MEMGVFYILGAHEQIQIISGILTRIGTTVIHQPIFMQFEVFASEFYPSLEFVHVTGNTLTCI